MPKGITGDFSDENGEEKEKQNSGRTTTGKVYINYSDYKVNVGLADSIFTEDKK
jgi:hypothetical protein